MSIAMRTADVTAIGLSGLCLAHCLALPLVAAVLPLAGVAADAHWVHWVFAFVAAPIAAWSLGRSRPRGRSLGAMVLGALGVILLFAAAAELPFHEAETAMTAAGSLMLVGAHLLNWRRREHGV